MLKFWSKIKAIQILMLGELQQVTKLLCASFPHL